MVVRARPDLMGEKKTGQSPRRMWIQKRPHQEPEWQCVSGIHMVPVRQRPDQLLAQIHQEIGLGSLQIVWERSAERQLPCVEVQPVMARKNRLESRKLEVI